jgi:hemerythrin
LCGENRRVFILLTLKKYLNSALAEYIDVHFTNEEAFMEEIGHPHLEEHKKVHEQFKENFYSLQPLINSGDDAAFRKALTDAFSWLLVHIGKSDKRYAKFYKEK